MSDLLPYILVGAITLLESGEFSLGFSGILLYLDVVSLAGVTMVTVTALLLSDMLWYQFGHYLYRIPLIRKVEPHLSHFDEHIHNEPFTVALVSRFTYGVHRFALARFRQNGVAPGQMFLIALGTTMPWVLLVGLVILALESAAPWVGNAFRFAEILLAVVFILFFILEVGLAARVRRAREIVHDTLIDLLVPPNAWTQRFVFLYGSALILLFGLLVLTPVLVDNDTLLLTEEGLEVFFLALVSLTGFFVYRSYVKQLRSVQEQYTSMAQHIGALNLQTVQVEALFNELVRIPESKRDFLRMLESLNTKVLAAISVPWVLTRIVDVRTGKTLTEHCSLRGGNKNSRITLPEINNKTLLANKGTKGCYTYYSDQDNTYVHAACIIPRRRLNHHQTVIMKVAINSIALLYLIYTSCVIHQPDGTVTDALNKK